MHHTALMREPHRLGDPQHRAQQVTARRPTRARGLCICIEPHAVHEPHHIEHTAVVECAGVVHGHDARMLETRQHPRFAMQPLRDVGRRELRRQHLDRHLALQVPVIRAMDLAHPASAKLPAQLVTTSDHRRHRELGAQARDDLISERSLTHARRLRAMSATVIPDPLP